MPGVAGNRTNDPLITSPTPNQLSYFVPKAAGRRGRRRGVAAGRGGGRRGVAVGRGGGRRGVAVERGGGRRGVTVGQGGRSGTRR